MTGRQYEGLTTRLMAAVVRASQFTARHPDVRIVRTGYGPGLYEAYVAGRVVAASVDLTMLLDLLESAEH